MQNCSQRQTELQIPGNVTFNSVCSMHRFWSCTAAINNTMVKVSKLRRKRYLKHSITGWLKAWMSNSAMVPTHSIIQSAFFFSFPAAAGTVRPANRNKEGGRDREKEGWSDRKRREWEHISRPFSVTFVLSVWRAPMNINMNPWRGNIVFFLLLTGYSCTQENHSSQSNGQSLSLCMAVWTVQPLLYSSLPLSCVWMGSYQWKTLYVKCNCGKHYNMEIRLD